MVNCYGFDSDIPDMDIDRVREDFGIIFENNAVDVLLLKTKKDDDVQENGDFFGTRTPTQIYRVPIRVFLSSVTSDAYKRAEQGIVTTDAMWHGMASWNTTINNDDILQFIKTTKIQGCSFKKGEQFRVSNHNKPFYKGQFAYQEFDLKKVDKENI